MRYSLIRLALFAPLLALLVILQLGWLPGVLFAALISFAISYLFLTKQRDAASAILPQARFSSRARPFQAVRERGEMMWPRAAWWIPLRTSASNFIQNRDSGSSPGMRS